MNVWGHYNLTLNLAKFVANFGKHPGSRLFDFYPGKMIGDPAEICKKKSNDKSNDTADGGNPANQLMLVVFPCFPILYKVLYTPVVQDFFHQQ